MFKLICEPQFKDKDKQVLSSHTDVDVQIRFFFYSVNILFVSLMQIWA